MILLKANTKECNVMSTAPQTISNKDRFSAHGISKREFEAELQKGIESIKNGRTHSVEDIDRMLAEEFGI